MVRTLIDLGIVLTVTPAVVVVTAFALGLPPAGDLLAIGALVLAAISLTLILAGVHLAVPHWAKARAALEHLAAQRALDLRRASPFSLRYLVPAQAYPGRRFKGAGPEERRTDRLHVGIGVYTVILDLEFTTGTTVDGVFLRFDPAGPDQPGSRPAILTTDHEVFTRRERSLFGTRYRDWWGNPQAGPAIALRHFPAGDRWVRGAIIETTGEWHGVLRVVLKTAEKGFVSQQLPFHAAWHGPDDIPFLRHRFLLPWRVLRWLRLIP